MALKEYKVIKHCSLFHYKKDTEKFDLTTPTPSGGVVMIDIKKEPYKSQAWKVRPTTEEETKLEDTDTDNNEDDQPKITKKRLIKRKKGLAFPTSLEGVDLNTFDFKYLNDWCISLNIIIDEETKEEAIKALQTHFG